MRFEHDIELLQLSSIIDFIPSSSLVNENLDYAQEIKLLHQIKQAHHNSFPKVKYYSLKLTPNYGNQLNLNFDDLNLSADAYYEIYVQNNLVGSIFYQNSFLSLRLNESYNLKMLGNVPGKDILLKSSSKLHFSGEFKEAEIVAIFAKALLLNNEISIRKELQVNCLNDVSIFTKICVPTLAIQAGNIIIYSAIAASKLSMVATNQIINQYNMFSDGIIMQANSLNNKGHMEGNIIHLSIKDNLINSGNISAIQVSQENQGQFSPGKNQAQLIINTQTIRNWGILSSAFEFEINSINFETSISSFTTSQHSLKCISHNIDIGGKLHAENLLFLRANDIRNRGVFDGPRSVYINAKSFTCDSDSNFNFKEIDKSIKFGREIYIEGKIKINPGAVIELKDVNFIAGKLSVSGKFSANKSHLRFRPQYLKETVKKDKTNRGKSIYTKNQGKIGISNSILYAYSFYTKNQALVSFSGSKLNIKIFLADSKLNMDASELNCSAVTFGKTNIKNSNIHIKRNCRIPEKTETFIKSTQLTANALIIEGKLDARGNSIASQKYKEGSHSKITSDILRVTGKFYLLYSTVATNTFSAMKESKIIGKDFSYWHATDNAQLHGQANFSRSQLNFSALSNYGSTIIKKSNVLVSNIIYSTESLFVDGAKITTKNIDLRCKYKLNSVLVNKPEDATNHLVLSGVGSVSRSNVTANFLTILDGAQVEFNQNENISLELLHSFGNTNFCKSKVKADTLLQDDGQLNIDECHEFKSKDLLNSQPAASVSIKNSYVEGGTLNLQGEIATNKSLVKSDSFYMAKKATITDSKIATDKDINLMGKNTYITHSFIESNGGLAISNKVDVQGTIIQAKKLSLKNEAKLSIKTSSVKINQDINSFGDIVLKNKAKLTGENISIYKNLTSKKIAKLKARNNLHLHVMSNLSCNETAVIAKNIEINNNAKFNESCMIADTAIDIRYGADVETNSANITTDNGRIFIDAISRIQGTKLFMKSYEIANDGNIDLTEGLNIDTYVLENINGTIHGGKALKIDADWLLLNLGGEIKADNLAITSAVSGNFLGRIEGSNNLTTHSLLDLNMVGLKQAYNMNSQSLISINSGLQLPSLPTDGTAILSANHCLALSRSILNMACPKLALPVNLAFNSFNFGQQALPLLWKGGKLIWDVEVTGEKTWEEASPFANIESWRLRDVLPMVLGAKSLVMSGIHLYKSANSFHNQISSSGWASLKDNLKWSSIKQHHTFNGKNILEAGLTAFGPTMVTDSLINANFGLIASQNIYQNSLFSLNAGATGALQSLSQNSCYAINTGLQAGWGLNLNGNKFINAGLLAGWGRTHTNIKHLELMSSSSLYLRNGIVIGNSIIERGKLNLENIAVNIKDLMQSTKETEYTLKNTNFLCLGETILTGHVKYNGKFSIICTAKTTISDWDVCINQNNTNEKSPSSSKNIVELLSSEYQFNSGVHIEADTTFLNGGLANFDGPTFIQNSKFNLQGIINKTDLYLSEADVKALNLINYGNIIYQGPLNIHEMDNFVNKTGAKLIPSQNNRATISNAPLNIDSKLIILEHGSYTKATQGKCTGNNAHIAGKLNIANYDYDMKDTAILYETAEIAGHDSSFHAKNLIDYATFQYSGKCKLVGHDNLIMAGTNIVTPEYATQNAPLVLKGGNISLRNGASMHEGETKIKGNKVDLSGNINLGNTRTKAHDSITFHSNCHLISDENYFKGKDIINEGLIDNLGYLNFTAEQGTITFKDGSHIKASGQNNETMQKSQLDITGQIINLQNGSSTESDDISLNGGEIQHEGKLTYCNSLTFLKNDSGSGNITLNGIISVKHDENVLASKTEEEDLKLQVYGNQIIFGENSKIKHDGMGTYGSVITVNGTIKGENQTAFIAKGNVLINDNTYLDVESGIVQGKDVEFNGQAQFNTEFKLLAENEVKKGINSDISAKNSGNGSTIVISGKTSDIKGKASADIGYFPIDIMPDAEDLIAGIGSYQELNFTQVLALKTSEDFTINTPIPRNCGLHISAKSISFHVPYETAHDISLTSSAGDILTTEKLSSTNICLNSGADLYTTSDIQATKQASYSAAGDYYNIGGNTWSDTLYIDVGQFYNITPESEKFATLPHDLQQYAGKEGSLNSREIIIQPRDGNAENHGGIIQALEHLKFILPAGDVRNIANVIEYQGKYDVMKEFQPGLIRGGNGRGYDGVGLSFDVSGKIYNIGSTYQSQGTIIYKAREGVLSIPLYHTYISKVEKKRKWWGKSEKSYKTETTVQNANFISEEGKNVFVCDDGTIVATATNFIAKEGNFFDSKYNAELYSLVYTQTSHSTKKSLWGAHKSKREIIEEKVVPILIYDNNISHISSREGDVLGRGVLFLGGGELFTTAENGSVRFDADILQYEYHMKNQGLFLSAPSIEKFEDLISYGFTDMICKANPILDKAKALLNSRHSEEWIANSFNTIIAASNDYEQLKFTFAHGNVSDFFIDRLGIKALLDPSINFNYHKAILAYTSQILGPATVRRKNWYIKAKDNINLSGLDVDLEQDLILIAPHVTMEGKELQSTSNYQEQVASLGVGITGGVNASYSHSTSAHTSTEYQNTKFKIDGNLHIEAENVQISAANVECNTLTGKIQTLTLPSKQDTITSTSNQVGIGSSTYGFFSAHHRNSAKINTPTSLHVREGINSDAKHEIIIDNTINNGALIISDKENTFKSTHIENHKIVDHDHATSRGFSGNLSRLATAVFRGNNNERDALRPSQIETITLHVHKRDFIGHHSATYYGKEGSSIISDDINGDLANQSSSSYKTIYNKEKNISLDFPISPYEIMGTQASKTNKNNSSDYQAALASLNCNLSNADEQTNMHETYIEIAIHEPVDSEESSSSNSNETAVMNISDVLIPDMNSEQLFSIAVEKFLTIMSSDNLQDNAELTDLIETAKQELPKKLEFTAETQKNLLDELEKPLFKTGKFVTNLGLEKYSKLIADSPLAVKLGFKLTGKSAISAFNIALSDKPSLFEQVKDAIIVCIADSIFTRILFYGFASEVVPYIGHYLFATELVDSLLYDESRIQDSFQRQEEYQSDMVNYMKNKDLWNFFNTQSLLHEEKELSKNLYFSHQIAEGSRYITSLIQNGLFMTVKELTPLTVEFFKNCNIDDYDDNLSQTFIDNSVYKK